MADGSTKPIEDVKPGDKVIATDPETGQTEAETVTAAIESEGVKHLVKVVIDTDGEQGTETAEVTATDGHPFWVPELGEWIDATDLRSGQLLRTSAGTYVQITTVERWTVGAAVVHNLTVGNIHTYYVVAGDRSLLVHNTNAACGWTNGKTTSANAAELRQNMVTDGWYGAKGEEAHHIVPSNHSRAAAARGILYNFGIDINNTANGVFLPGWGALPTRSASRCTEETVCIVTWELTGLRSCLVKPGQGTRRLLFWPISGPV